MEFSLFLGLYDSEFTMTWAYDQLLIDYPLGEMAAEVWNHSFSVKNYEPGLTKASCIVSPALCYIHAVMVQSFAGRANSQGVVERHELLYLYSMTEHR